MFFRNCFLLFTIVCSVQSTYNVKKITKSIGTLLATPNWSVAEQTLFFIDFSGGTFYRLKGDSEKITSRKIGTSGPFGLITPLKGSPGYVVVGIKTSLYVMNCNAPNVTDSLRLLTTVDLGKPDNILLDGKVDAMGRLYFGTLGMPISVSFTVPDQGTLYKITSETFTSPSVVIRPVSSSAGLVWSLNNDKFYYNDAQTRKISYYDYDLKKGQIANRKTLFDFDKNCIDGIPNGMTIDSDGNIWLATYAGAEVLRIDAKTGIILLRIKIPDVDIVSSVIWGGKKLDVLYVTTGFSSRTPKPKPNSGSLYRITVKGCRGVPQNFFRLEDVENY